MVTQEHTILKEKGNKMGSIMEFKVGDYFKAKDGRTGYVLDVSTFNSCQYVFTLGFSDGEQITVEYNHLGLYLDSGFVYYGEMFNKIGKYIFEKKGTIEPLKHYFLSDTREWNKNVVDKINEIISVLNDM